MASKSDEVLKKLESDDLEKNREHSLRENAIERTQDPLHINAGTAFDWEDKEAYEKELERIDKEKPFQKK